MKSVVKSSRVRHGSQMVEYGTMLIEGQPFTALGYVRDGKKVTGYISGESLTTWDGQVLARRVEMEPWGEVHPFEVYKTIVRLPSRRFLAGWSYGEGGLAVLELVDDEEEAWEVADSAAEAEAMRLAEELAAANEE